MLSQRAALWVVAGIILFVGLAAVLIWRIRMKREIRTTGKGDLVRECAKCGFRLRPGMVSCPRCGSDANALIA